MAPLCGGRLPRRPDQVTGAVSIGYRADMAKGPQNKKKTRAGQPKPKPQPEATAGPAGKDEPECDEGGMDWRSLHLWQIQPVRDGLFLTAVVFLVLLGYWLSTITVPLLIALALAYLTEPLIERAHDKWGWSRQRSIFVLLGLALVLVAVAVFVAVPLVVGQTLRLVSQAPAYLDRIQAYFAEQGYSPTMEQLVETVKGWLSGGSEPVKAGPMFSTAGEAVRVVGAILGSVVYLLFLLFLIPFYYYFFALWYPNIVAFSGKLVPDAKQERVVDLVRKMDRAVSGFVRGRLVICSIMGIMFSIGWGLCGVPYWLLLGLFTGALSLVPYVGGVGLPMAVGLLYFKLADSPEEAINYWRLLWPILVFGVVQFAEGYILVPLIQGKATNLDPVTLLVAVLAGGTIMGIYGMILAIPLAACSKILLIEVVWPRFRAWAEGEEADPLPISRE
jgi:predicted PurR-regulated permease PerM